MWPLAVDCGGVVPFAECVVVSLAVRSEKLKRAAVPLSAEGGD